MNRGPVKLVGSKKHKNPPISFYINTAASDSREIINKCQCASSPGNHNSTIRLSKWGVVCFGSQGLPLSSHLPFNVLCFTALPNLCVFECLAWGCILYWVPWGSDLKDLFHPLTKKKNIYVVYILKSILVPCSHKMWSPDLVIMPNNQPLTDFWLSFVYVYSHL